MKNKHIKSGDRTIDKERCCLCATFFTWQTIQFRGGAATGTRVLGPDARDSPRASVGLGLRSGPPGALGHGLHLRSVTPRGRRPQLFVAQDQITGSGLTGQGWGTSNFPGKVAYVRYEQDTVSREQPTPSAAGKWVPWLRNGDLDGAPRGSHYKGINSRVFWSDNYHSLKYTNSNPATDQQNVSQVLEHTCEDYCHCNPVLDNGIVVIKEPDLYL